MAETKKKSGSKAKQSKAAGAKTKGKSETSRRAPLAPRTWFAQLGKTEPKWWVVDASGQTLGRLSTRIAQVLMGKNSPQYTKHAATGDFVVVINAEKIRLTGKKWQDKTYKWYTGYPSGVKSITAEELREKHPERLVRWAVEGMLPANHVGRRWRKRLRVFAGAEHPHTAQRPEPVKLGESRA